MAIDNLYETTDETLTKARAAGAAYWKRNRPAHGADIAHLARTLGYWQDHERAFVSGYYAAKTKALAES